MSFTIPQGDNTCTNRSVLSKTIAWTYSRSATSLRPCDSDLLSRYHLFNHVNQPMKTRTFSFRVKTRTIALLLLDLLLFCPLIAWHEHYWYKHGVFHRFPTSVATFNQSCPCSRASRQWDRTNSLPNTSSNNTSSFSKADQQWDRTNSPSNTTSNGTSF